MILKKKSGGVWDMVIMSWSMKQQSKLSYTLLIDKFRFKLKNGIFSRIESIQYTHMVLSYYTTYALQFSIIKCSFLFPLHWIWSAKQINSCGSCLKIWNQHSQCLYIVIFEIPCIYTHSCCKIYWNALGVCLALFFNINYFFIKKKPH